MNMFGLRFTMDAQARCEERRAAPDHDRGRQQELEPEASARGDTACWSGWPGIRSDIAIATSGTVRTRLIQNRLRHVARSSGLASSASVTCRRLAAPCRRSGTRRSRPHDLRMHRADPLGPRGQRLDGDRLEAPSRTSGTRPGPAWRTSGSMGQV